MLSTSVMKVRNERVISNSFRLQAQILNISNMKILWINGYLPNDSISENVDCKEILDTLAEVKRILDTSVYTDVIWIGDFNWDRSRTSRFANIMEKFMSDMNLVDVWDKFQVSHTHIHTDLKSTSTIDRVLVNERLLEFISDAGALNIGDNPSRHSPI